MCCLSGVGLRVGPFVYDYVMDSNRRFQIMQSLAISEEEIFKTKGYEYTGGADDDNDRDALANFKGVGEMVQHTCSSCGKMEPVGPRTVWAVYFMKHVFSLLTHAANPSRGISEPVDSRLLDVRAYATLYGCIDEDDSTSSDVASAAKSHQKFEDL